MKCKNCDREAVYDDGLCESCHRAAVENERVQVLSREEKNSFRGKTIDADGSVHVVVLSVPLTVDINYGINWEEAK